MNATSPEEAAEAFSLLRWGVYWLLIAIAIGGVTGRVLAVNSVDYVRLEKYLKDSQKRPDWQKQRPFLSANDRSRWATVRALVEHGTYAIDEIVSEPNWDTIDVVKHDDEGHAAPKPDEGHIYSSKPTLLPTIMAGEYWLIVRLTGETLATHPYAIGRVMLITFNVLPLLVYFILWGKVADRLGTTDWGRIFTMTCATLATFLTTFAVVINNHLPAAVTALATLYLGLRITQDGDRRWWIFLLTGLFAALTAADELPALSLLAAVGALLLWHAPRPTLLAFTPGALLVAAAAIGTNYLAHHTWSTPYAHKYAENDNWYDFQYIRDGKIRDSYWGKLQGRSEIDKGEPSVGRYALHALVGHHGIFSLSPIWLLSVLGLAMLLLDREAEWRQWGLLIAAVSLVCIVFYIFLVGEEERNYGGSTSGFRWVFWLAPLWLAAMQPAADWLGRRRAGQIVAALLLTASVVSVSYPTWNPWTHPWPYDLMESMGALRRRRRIENGARRILTSRRETLADEHVTATSGKAGLSDMIEQPLLKAWRFSLWQLFGVVTLNAVACYALISNLPGEVRLLALCLPVLTCGGAIVIAGAALVGLKSALAQMVGLTVSSLGFSVIAVAVVAAFTVSLHLAAYFAYMSAA